VLLPPQNFVPQLCSCYWRQKIKNTSRWKALNRDDIYTAIKEIDPLMTTVFMISIASGINGKANTSSSLTGFRRTVSYRSMSLSTLFHVCCTCLETANFAECSVLFVVMQIISQTYNLSSDVGVTECLKSQDSNLLPG